MTGNKRKVEKINRKNLERESVVCEISINRIR